MRALKLIVVGALFVAGFLLVQGYAQQASLMAGEGGKPAVAIAPSPARQLSPEKPVPAAPLEVVAEAPPDVEPVPELEPEPEPQPAVSMVTPSHRRAKSHRRAPKALALIVPAPVEPDEALRAALRQHHTALERCYDRELRTRATFEGTMLISISVTADGRVVRASVEEAGPREAAVGACMVARIRELKLPRLSSDADVTLPIQLQAVEPRS